MNCPGCGVKIVGRMKTKKVYIKDGKVYAEPVIMIEYTIKQDGTVNFDRVVALCPICGHKIGEK